MGGFAAPVPPPPLGPYDAGGWSAGADSVGGNDLFPFSSMSGDQIVEALSRAGGDFDMNGGGGGGAGGGGFATGLEDGHHHNGGGGGAGVGGGGGFVWDEGSAMDFLPSWSNWPDFGF